MVVANQQREPLDHAPCDTHGPRRLLGARGVAAGAPRELKKQRQQPLRRRRQLIFRQLGRAQLEAAQCAGGRRATAAASATTAGRRRLERSEELVHQRRPLVGPVPLRDGCHSDADGGADTRHPVRQASR